MSALILAVTLCISTGASAAPAFSRADKNGDGFVSYPEARRGMPELSEVHFDKYDLDRDGQLHSGEYAGLDAFYSMMYRSN